VAGLRRGTTATRTARLGPIGSRRNPQQNDAPCRILKAIPDWRVEIAWLGPGKGASSTSRTFPRSPRARAAHIVRSDGMTFRAARSTRSTDTQRSQCRRNGGGTSPGGHTARARGERYPHIRALRADR